MKSKPSSSLADRHKAEAAFHDQKVDPGDLLPRHYSANPTSPIFSRMLTMLGPDLSGLRVLEYGCGSGWITAELAGRGATVSAFDISPVAVRQTTALLADKGLLHRCSVRVMAGERLEYQDDTFDIAVGFAILHHLELPTALKELRRVLRPSAKAYFAEPLGSNPLINLYRSLTPQFRTVDEAPIKLHDFTRQAAGFSSFEHHDQLLLASGALALCYLPFLTRAAAPLQRCLMRVDDALLRVVPQAGHWAWYSILALQK